MATLLLPHEIGTDRFTLIALTQAVHDFVAASAVQTAQYLSGTHCKNGGEKKVMRPVAPRATLLLICCLAVACGYLTPGEELARQYKRGERDFSLQTLDEINLDSAQLPGVNLSFASLRNAVFRNADLSGANLNGAVLYQADLRGANLSGADLRTAGLYESAMEGANLAQALLQGAILAESNLQEASLAGADLEDAVLARADLKGADLTGANLQDADLTRTQLRDAILDGANLRGTNVTEGQLAKARSLQGTTLPDGTIQQ